MSTSSLLPREDQTIWVQWDIEDDTGASEKEWCEATVASIQPLRFRDTFAAAKGTILYKETALFPKQELHYVRFLHNHTIRASLALVSGSIDRSVDQTAFPWRFTEPIDQNQMVEEGDTPCHQVSDGPTHSQSSLT